MFRSLSLLLCFLLLSSHALAKRKVIIDQDAFEGPGLQPILMLLQDPTVEVLGITTVSGDGWQPEETAKTLRMLELVGRADIPVAPGATYPILNSKASTERREQLYGKLGYKGAWTEVWPEGDDTQRPPYHGPEFIPDLKEGNPTIQPLPTTAANFFLEQTAKYPGEVTIIAMGPLTNLALAQRLDYTFAPRVKEVIMMGGYFNLQLSGDHGIFTTQVAYSPRMTFNQLWDPEAAHIVHTSPWQKLTLVSGDTSASIFGTEVLLDEIAASSSPVARYVTSIAQPGFPLWDEVEAAIWLDPSIVTEERIMTIGIDTMPGPNYGAIVTWPEGRSPGLGEQPVHIILSVDQPRAEALFVDLLSR